MKEKKKGGVKMIIEFGENVEDVEFSFTSNPTKILISARCKCGNKMEWVTEGILLCEGCGKYSDFHKEG